MSAPIPPNTQAVFVHDAPEKLGALPSWRDRQSPPAECSALLCQEVEHRAVAMNIYGILLSNWAHVQVYFGDERRLPRGDSGRNDHMAGESLLKYVDIPPANVHPIPAELGAREAAAYATLLDKEMPLDLVLLGMGEDGHTASPFPGNPALECAAGVVPIFDAPKPAPERVSLGLSALNAARARIFLVAGAGKREASNRILCGASLPAARVAAAEWHFDRAAWPG